MGDRQRKIRGNDPALSAPRGHPGMRRLVIRGETWHWRFGHQVSIRDPRGKGHNVSLTDMLSRGWDDIERAAWKRSLAVEPSEVIDHIERKVLGYTDAGGFPTGSPWRGHQAAIRDGWVAFEGPRGTWQARLGVWVTDIRSPEDVQVQARTYEVLGMDIHEWTGVKIAHMEANGQTFDEYASAERKRLGGRVDSIRLLMEYEAPGTPLPTAAQLGDYVARLVAAASRTAMAA